MARNPGITKRRNAAIVQEYERLRAMRVGRGRKYTPAYIVAQLSERFYLSERTIEDIVWAARD